ncbi:type I DNA topoisomerase [bacterium]|nr:type I DNA topoisomerase [bacterium]
MAKNLVIVESPAKAKTIQGYLGKDFSVIATVGHLIDLPTNKIGVDIENNYEMIYTNIKGKDKIISDIKKAVKATTGTVYLAQDPDREGESIAWQVEQICQFSKKSEKVRRAVFHEITKDAIKAAINKTRDVDEDLVEAQQSRRVLDRLVGYPLSQLLWKKIQFGLSAGRVQSAALRLVVEREEEIRAFIPAPYTTFVAKYRGIDVTFTLVDAKGSMVKAAPDEGDTFKKFLDKVNKHEVIEHKTKTVTSSPPPPLVTSTMQQAANQTFGFTAKMTMKIAQELYQGVDVKDKGGRIGLISYMRTDSVSMSEQALVAIRKLIESRYGKQFVNETVRRYKTKSRVAQEAHEAIRPTHVELAPDQVKQFLTPQQYKLYSLIWRRAVATQMKPQVLEEENVRTIPMSGEARTMSEKLKWSFEAVSQKEVFAGYRLLKQVGEKEIKPLPEVKKGDVLDVAEVITENLLTVPRSRYTDAPLVKEMEKLGIGRPSTYATIIGTLITRNYITREMKLLTPTEIGMLVCNFLKKHFTKIVDYAFTAEMEKELDNIANSKSTKKKMIDTFYPEFAKDIEEKNKTIVKEELTSLGETDKECRKCKTKMHLKIGPWGKYYACPNEECKNKEPFIDMTKYYVPEEVDKEGYILKKGRFGIFWAHPDYPEVKKTMPVLLKEVCPDCGAHLVERRGKTGRPFVGCSAYPNCKYIKSRYFKKGAKSSDRAKTSIKGKGKATTKKTTKKAPKKSASKTKAKRTK